MTESTSAAARAEAAVKAALVEIDMGQNDKAAADLKKAMTMPEIGKLKGVAAFGLLKIQ